MRSIVLLALSGVICLAADAAQVARIVRSERFDQVQGIHSARAARPRASSGSDKIDILNCGSDGIIDSDWTLSLGPGDLAGSMFSVGSAPNPYRVAALHLGLYDVGSSYPTQIELLILESDAAGEIFDGIASFTVGIEGGIASGGEILTLDLRDFGVTGRNDLLILYGGIADGVHPPLRPAGDSSPRCGTQSLDNVCSYVLPPWGNMLYLYGDIDALACPDTEHHFYAFDIVMEVLLDSPGTPLQESSFGILKGRY